MRYPCSTCPKNADCRMGLRCVDWRRWFGVTWDYDLRKAAHEIEKAAHVATHGRPVTDNFVPYRKYVYGHILTACWRNVHH